MDEKCPQFEKGPQVGRSLVWLVGDVRVLLSWSLDYQICDIVFVVSETGASSIQPSNRFQFPPPTGKEVHVSQLEPKNAKSPCFVL